MLTVNCGAEASDATPFCLAQVIPSKRNPSGTVELLMQWFQLKGGQRGAGSDLCFRGIYEQMYESDCDNIPASSVLCRFQSLKEEGRIPRMVQRMTHETIEPLDQGNAQNLANS